jgi:two-component system cell cycle sensor histidine kinase/response regulator CckA
VFDDTSGMSSPRDEHPTETIATSAFESPGRILVVDDEAGPRALAVNILERQLHTVYQATGGEEALRMADEVHPDLILLDMKMPRMAGIEVCRRLKANPVQRYVPIIMLTALSDAEAQAEALESGANDFLTKPPDRLILGARVRSLLKYRRALLAIQRQQSHLEQRIAERTHDLVLANAALKLQIQERQRAEQALQLREEQFRQAQKMEAIGRLAGGVAHDFNNLLTIMLGHTTLLRAQPAPSPAALKNGLDEIQKAGDRASGLVRQMLLFSRRQVLQPTVLDLNDRLSGLLRLIRPLIREDIELVKRMGQALGHVRADAGHLDQVILNLVVNARDAMPKGGRLILATDNVDLHQALPGRPFSVPSGSYVVLTVSDTGIGMTPDVQGRLFEPFFTTKAAGIGTGLGLATVYGIVEQSGGHIWVNSESGKGSTFRVFLPRVQAAVEAAPAPAALPAPGRGHETLLLVEDDDSVRSFLSGYLKSKGYRVLEAPHGLAALDVHRQLANAVDLLVTDVVMPRMGGRELAEQLWRLQPSLKVLFLTGYSDDAGLSSATLKRGARLLLKPVAPDRLAADVRALLDTPA